LNAEEFEWVKKYSFLTNVRLVYFNLGYYNGKVNLRMNVMMMMMMTSMTAAIIALTETEFL
jgi:hypothetical protein